jgi:hypothetical protein
MIVSGPSCIRHSRVKHAEPAANVVRVPEKNVVNRLRTNVVKAALSAAAAALLTACASAPTPSAGAPAASVPPALRAVALDDSCHARTPPSWSIRRRVVQAAACEWEAFGRPVVVFQPETALPEAPAVLRVTPGASPAPGGEDEERFALVQLRYGRQESDLSVWHGWRGTGTVLTPATPPMCAERRRSRAAKSSTRPGGGPGRRPSSRG